MTQIRKGKRFTDDAESHELLQKLNKRIFTNHTFLEQAIKKRLRMNLKNRTRKSLSRT